MAITVPSDECPRVDACARVGVPSVFPQHVAGWCRSGQPPLRDHGGPDRKRVRSRALQFWPTECGPVGPSAWLRHASQGGPDGCSMP